MKDLIERLYSDESSMIPREATSKDIALCQRELSELKLPALPASFLDFLHIANGFVWNGILFYSTDEVTDEEDDFVLDDIITANEVFQENREMPEKLLLGFSDEDLYTYDTTSKKFEILDFTSTDKFEEYDEFEDLFNTVVGGRLATMD